MENEYNFYEMFDEAYKGIYDQGFFPIVGDYYHVKCVSDDYEQSGSDTRGTSDITITVWSLDHFYKVYHLLCCRGYNLMKSIEQSPYMLYVFDLTDEDIENIVHLLRGRRRLVPLCTSGQAA